MSSTTSPCAACKLQRRKCTQECVFAPYFPPDQPQKFENVHKVFGASNVAKILNELSTTQREDAVNSLAYEAEARLRDPVYGCVGLISILQHRLKQVQIDLYNAKKELSTYIGPSAMLPILQHPGFIQPHQNNSSSSSSVMPYNMSPSTILGLPAGGGYNAHHHHQLLIRDPQLQQPHHHHHHHHHLHQQMLEAQRLAAAAAREQQGILTTFEQQQQELVRFNGGFESVGTVGANGFAAQVSGGAVMSPSLALGCFEDPYQIQQQPQDHHSHSHHQLQLQLQPQLLIQQQPPQPPKQQQRSGSDDGQRVGPSC